MPEKGEKVIVFGNPQGMKFSVSEGIVAAVQTFPTKDYPMFKGTYIQFTAPISPGSSGGPILRATGEVVGISTWLLNPGVLLNQNINFAIPATMIPQLAQAQKGPLIADESAVQPSASKDKPTVGVVIIQGGRLTGNISPRSAPKLDNQIGESIAAKFVPSKFTIIPNEQVRPQLTAFYLQETGLKKLPLALDRQYIKVFCQKQGYNYFLLCNIDIVDYNEKKRQYTTYDVLLEAYFLVYDNLANRYIYEKSIRALGPEANWIYPGVEDALRRALILFSRDFSLVN